MKTGQSAIATRTGVNNGPMRPFVTIIIAMSADGKIADRALSPARFTSTADKAHLQARVSEMDAVMFGANTLRAYGTSVVIREKHLLAARKRQNKPPQPVHIVCSATGDLSEDMAFFRQPFPRWLLTTPQGAQKWHHSSKFTKILPLCNPRQDWSSIFATFTPLGIEKLGILGGGTLIASVAEQYLIDELWLTVCPVLLGGTTTPTPFDGSGLFQNQGIKLNLLEHYCVDSEIFLHYQIRH